MMTPTNSFPDNWDNPETRHKQAGQILDLAISAQIRHYRKLKHWSQATLAKKAGLHQSQISAMETDGYSEWTIATLQKLAGAFDVALIVGFEGWSVFITWARIWINVEDITINLEKEQS